MWSISRSPHSPQSYFNRKKRTIVSCLSEFCRHSHAFHEKCTHQGSNSHTMFAQKTFFASFTRVYAISQTFFGKVPGVQFPLQRYTGVWSISRSPHSPQSYFNRKKRTIVSCLSEFCRHSHAFHEKCTHQGSNSHTMFAQKTFFASFTRVYAISQSTWPI